MNGADTAFAGVETVVETERLVLTNWRPDQIDDVVLLHSDPDITRYLTRDGQPEPREKAVARLEHWAADFARHRMGKLRVTRKSDGAFLGRAGFGIYLTGEPELGYTFLRQHWGHGYAREAARGLRDWIFAETDFDHFIGFADMRNTASLAVLSAIGMVKTGIRNEPYEDHPTQFFIFQRGDLHG